MGIIYTIGHGNLSIEDFIQELRSFDIKYLVDIRSKPYSKYCPHFCQEALKARLTAEHFVYVYMGDSIGGLPSDRNCYTNGKVNYAKLALQVNFQTGIHRLKCASEKALKLAIMCSESDPKQCHRFKLVGKELTKLNVPVMHIESIGKAKSQLEEEILFTGGWGTTDLFGETPVMSRKKHVEEIDYVA